MAISTPEPTHPTCPHLYRYQRPKLERLKPVILEHELYLPSVSQLNDPVDCRPKLTQLTVDEMETFLLTGYVLSHAWESVDELAKQVAVIHVNVQTHGLEWCMRESAGLLNTQMETIRVLSLSKRFNNMCLWANYADNPFHLVDPTQRTPRFLIHKRPEWSNEEEVRLLRERNSKPTVKIDPKWLKRIILGKDMTDDDEKTIRAWAKQRQPELLVVRAYFDELQHELFTAGV